MVGLSGLWDEEVKLEILTVSVKIDNLHYLLQVIVIETKVEKLREGVKKNINYSTPFHQNN